MNFLPCIKFLKFFRGTEIDGTVVTLNGECEIENFIGKREQFE